MTQQSNPSVSHDTTPRLVLATGHSAPAVNAVFLSDDKMIASVGYDRSLILWDVETGEMIRKIQSPNPDFMWTGFSPDGTYATSDDTVREGRSWFSRESIWNVVTGVCEVVLRDYVYGVGVSPRGKYLAGSSDVEGECIVLLDYPSQRIVRRLEYHNDGLQTNVVFSRNGTTLAARSYSRIWLYDLCDDDHTRVLEVPSGVLEEEGADSPSIYDVALSADGSLVAGLCDRKVRVWRVDTGEYIATLSSTYYGPGERYAAFSPEGAVLAIGDEDGILTLYDTADWTVRYRVPVHGGWLRSVSFSADGSRLVTAGNDGVVRIVQASTGDVVRSLGWERCGVKAVVFLKDGKTLISGHDDGAIRFWNMETVTLKETIPIGARPVGHITLLPESSLAAIYMRNPNSWDDTEVVLLDLVTREIKESLPGRRFLLAVSPDERLCVTSIDDGSQWLPVELEVRKADSGEVVRTLSEVTGNKEFEHGIASAVFSSDGKTLAVGHWGFTVSLWNVETGERVGRIDVRRDSVGALAFSPDGQTLAVGTDYDSVVQLFSTKTFKEKRRLTEHTDSINSVAFSPDGRVLATASADGTIRLWNPGNGRLLATLVVLPSRDEGVTSDEWVAFTPDGYYTGSENAERFIRWEVDGVLLPGEQFRDGFRRD